MILINNSRVIIKLKNKIKTYNEIALENNYVGLYFFPSTIKKQIILFRQFPIKIIVMACIKINFNINPFTPILIPTNYKQ